MFENCLILQQEVRDLHVLAARDEVIENMIK